MHLQIFAKDGCNIWDIIDGELKNPPKCIVHACWHILIKVSGNCESILIKPSDRFGHFQQKCVRNEWKQDLFVQNEVLLATEVRGKRCQIWIECIENFQVESLHTQVELVSTVLHFHKTGSDNTSDVLHHALAPPLHFLFSIRETSKGLGAKEGLKSVQCFAKVLKII